MWLRVKAPLQVHFASGSNSDYAGIHLALAPICIFWEFSYVLWVVKVFFASSFLSIPFSHMDQIRIISPLIRSFTSFLSSKANPFSNVFAIFAIE